MRIKPVDNVCFSAHLPKKQRDNEMKKELKPNTLVMWRGKEFKFIKFIDSTPKRAIIQMDCEKWQREIPIEELDLITKEPTTGCDYGIGG